MDLKKRKQSVHTKSNKDSIGPIETPDVTRRLDSLERDIKLINFNLLSFTLKLYKDFVDLDSEDNEEIFQIMKSIYPSEITNQFKNLLGLLPNIERHDDANIADDA